MSCDLIERSKNKLLTADDFKNQTEVKEDIYNSDHFDIQVRRCNKCGQIYINCFAEYISYSWESDDQCWNFWIPVTEDKVKELKEAKYLASFIEELVTDGGHICWHPDGKVFWAEGCLVAPILFRMVG